MTSLTKACCTAQCTFSNSMTSVQAATAALYRKAIAEMETWHNVSKQATTRIETVANIFERLPGMQCVENYLCLYSMDSTNPQAAAEALQQATYAAQLAALERCIHSLRINMSELDACIVALGKLVHECTRLYAGLPANAQWQAHPPVPSPHQLVGNLRNIRECCQHDLSIKRAAVNALVYDMAAHQVAELCVLFADMKATPAAVYKMLEAPLVALQPNKPDSSM